MDEIESIARKWGDSVAVIIPKKIAVEKKVMIGDKIKLYVKKKNGLRELFGILETKNKSERIKLA